MFRSAPALLLLGACLFMPAPCAPAAGGCPPPDFHAGRSATLHARLDLALPRLLSQYQVPGTALALVEDGRVAWQRGYGLAEPASGVAVTPRTLFQAASDSKPVTAWLALELVQRGRVRLDAPIEDALGGWRLPPSRWDAGGVTLRRVLSHTAGLSIPGYGGFPPGQPVQTLLESLAGAADAGGRPLAIVAAPGAGFAYSGGGYTLTQLMIRRVTGRPFADVARERVLKPLGMTDSSFPPEPAPSPPLAWTFDADGRHAPPRRFTALAAAGLQTTAGDLGRFVAALMPGPCGEPAGRGLLAPAMIDAMLTPQPNSDNDLVLSDSRYGLGLALKRLPSGRLLAYHPGDNLPDWHNLIAALPERRAGLVLMTNAAGGRHMRVAVLCTWLAALGEPLPETCRTLGIAGDRPLKAAD